MTTGFVGSRWWKFDFHTHTPVSTCTPWHALRGGPDALAPRQWLLRYMGAGIDCVAVTDHNSGEWIDELSAAYEVLRAENGAEFRPLFLFPGVELSVNGGVHVLAIFDRAHRKEDIDTLLGRVDYEGTKGDSDGCTRRSLVQVVEQVSRIGGIVIPAHSDAEKGLLRVDPAQPGKALFDPLSLTQVLDSGSVYAAEFVTAASPRPTLYTQRNCRWTEVVGSDCHNFRSKNVPGSRFTWVKMADPSLEGLRLALLDGNAFSIYRSDTTPQGFDPNRPPENWIESVEVRDGRFMGRGAPCRIEFSPWMTALVGGRGTGKSSIVHFLRSALHREVDLERLAPGCEPRRAFEGFRHVAHARTDDGGLVSDSAVSVVYRHAGKRFRVSWTPGRHHVEEGTEDGAWHPAASQEVRERFPASIFSQGHVLALADSGGAALVSLVDAAAGCGAPLEQSDDALGQFLSKRAELRQVQKKLSGRDRVMAQLEDTCRKLTACEAVHKSPEFRTHEHRKAQLLSAEYHATTVEEVAGTLDGLAMRLELGAGPGTELGGVDAVDDAVAAAWRDLVENAARTRANVEAGAATLRAAVESFRAATTAGLLRAGATAALDHYSALLAELTAKGVAELSDFDRLVQEKSRLERELTQLDSLEVDRVELERAAETCRQRVLAARTDLQARRDAFVTDTLAKNRFVKMELVPFGAGPREAEASFRELIGAPDTFRADILTEDGQAPTGLLARLFEGLPDERAVRLAAFEARVEALRQDLAASALGGASPFGGHFVNYLRRTWDQHPEIIDRVLAWSPPDGLAVEYSPSGDGRDFRPIAQGSAGQRSAAMLAFLLAHGREPIVLDQPEDDLDNHLIYDLVVSHVREMKQSRQVVAVTHNANVVVNGDAEMIAALDVTAGQCRLSKAGSLQDEEVREEVCRVMEGGHEAFRRRYTRLARRGNGA